MFNFFKKKGKENPEHSRKQPSEARSSECAGAPTNEPTKDVVNLLIPNTDYRQKNSVEKLLDAMAGKRRKGKKKRAESCRKPVEMKETQLQRSKSDVEHRSDVTPSQNNSDTNPAEFVKALVLQKYAKPDKHVSLVYVSDEDQRRHAEALLREIAKSIDCTIDEIEAPMGSTDSKNRREPVYHTIDETNNNKLDNYNNGSEPEPEKIIITEEPTLEDTESIAEVSEESNLNPIIKKSNLKPPKSDTEAYSDDERSDSGKKKVTFRKHIIFDDGEQQTDEEVDSFESATSEEDEYLEDLPDNDELLGGYVVSRNDEENKSVVIIEESTEDDEESPATDVLKRIASDTSDSGFIEISDKQDCDDKSYAESSNGSESEVESGSEVESESEDEVIEIIEEEIIEILPQVIEPDDPRHFDNRKSLSTDSYEPQCDLSELDARCADAERASEVLAACRKEIHDKDHEIQQLKGELAAAYKESELVRQRSRSLEEELTAARCCSARLADQLHEGNEDIIRQLRAELEDSHNRRAELESRVLALERERDRLEQDRALQEQKAQEALAAAEANTAKWRAAHEAARSQAAARAERMLGDCEWKMRELEKRARDAERINNELTQEVLTLKANPKQSETHLAELQQLRGVVSEQQRSVQALTLQLQKVETREEALKLEVHRLKELLERESRIGKEKEERHLKTIQRLEQQHSKALETLKAEAAASAASTRATLERNHAERTRSALAQLREESEKEAKNAERKLREVSTRLENLKEVLAAKEAQFEHGLNEAQSKADWDLMQLRHLLDKADIAYANNAEQLSQRFEREKEALLEEWTEKVRVLEEEASTVAEESRTLLESTRTKLIAEKNEQVSRLKEQHRQEMDEQFEQFMTDKENCLSRMKMECIQEGEEERVKREKELLEEIAELRSQLNSKSVDFDHLAVKTAACGRTLAVTEQELREALARERDLREKRAEDATKIKQVERSSKDQIEHLTRKCACLKKLFDDMRARLTAKERATEQECRAKDKEIIQLKAEVARLTKMLVQQDLPQLGARTRADGCETAQNLDECFFAKPAPIAETQANAPRRKGMS